jgi:hypothetical protein
VGFLKEKYDHNEVFGVDGVFVEQTERINGKNNVVFGKIALPLLE